MARLNLSVSGGLEASMLMDVIMGVAIRFLWERRMSSSKMMLKCRVILGVEVSCTVSVLGRSEKRELSLKAESMFTNRQK
jgi:hypothetical protein